MEGAAPNHGLVDLSGDGDQGAGIHVGVRDGGDEIGGAGTAGSHAHARLARRTSIALGSEAAALFMPRKDGSNLGLG